MLKATIVNAVTAARDAFGDLLVDAFLVKRESGAYIPGTTPQYTETEAPIKVYLARYLSKEIDNDRVLASDFKAIVFPVDGQNALLPLAVPGVNDVIRIAEKSYRVMRADNLMAGDISVLSESQVRLP